MARPTKWLLVSLVAMMEVSPERGPLAAIDGVEMLRGGETVIVLLPRFRESATEGGMHCSLLSVVSTC
jgi:hypothetical protein